MIEPFSVSASQLLIPDGWKVNWDHISAGCTIHPEIRFESLLCLSMKPDFVLDFGWDVRDDQVRFTLQINQGHFGLSDVVIAESWYAVSPALDGLQLWLNRLSADDATKRADIDLQSRLDIIEKRILHYFIPPLGEIDEELFAHVIRRLIMKQPASYWEAGSGDSAIQYRNRHGVVQSQLIFILREPHGVHMEFHGPEGPALCLMAKKRGKEKIIQVQLGGAPWDLPHTQFVSRTMAARVIKSYIDEGTGKCPSQGQWSSP